MFAMWILSCRRGGDVGLLSFFLESLNSILAWCCSLGVVSYAMQEDDDDDLRKLGT